MKIRTKWKFMLFMKVEVWTWRFGLFTKRYDEIEMMCSMEDIMNFVVEHELVQGDYGTHFTTNKVNNITFY